MEDILEKNTKNQICVAQHGVVSAGKVGSCYFGDLPGPVVDGPDISGMHLTLACPSLNGQWWRCLPTDHGVNILKDHAQLTFYERLQK
eukprot:5251524-Amphidinium_carterae.1